MMPHQSDNGYAWYQCKCCPYGYHIDLDFVRYCETIGQPQVERSGSIKRRKDRRRQRQSMEVLLGLTIPTPIIDKQQMPLTPIIDTPPPPPPRPILISDDELNDVVLDFERTLQRSKNKLSNNLPDVTAVSETSRPRRVSVSSMSSTSSSSMTILRSAGGDAPRDFDTVSIESSSTCGGLSPAALQTIREQMALGLERTRELEDTVRMIPSLQAQIAQLQDENRQLKEDKLNRLNSNYLFPCLRNRSASFSESIDNLKIPPPPPPRRDFGVTAGVLTRNIGVGQSLTTKNASTITQPENKHQDRWYAQKSRFLNGNDEHDHIPSPSKRDSQTQTVVIPKKETRAAGVQTLHVLQYRDTAVQTLQLSAFTVHCGVNAVVETASACLQVQPQTLSTGVSDDTTDDFCTKCKVSKKSIGVNTNLAQQLEATAAAEQTQISLAALSSRSKSFHLGENTLSHRAPTLPVNSKSSQTETKKLATKHSQYESLHQCHKAIQHECEIVRCSKSTETIGLIPVPNPKKTKGTDTKGLFMMKHKACETVQVEQSAVACNTDEEIKEIPRETVSVCAKCKNSQRDEEAIRKLTDEGTPSRIPRLQIPTSPTITTPVENRLYKRQDTYTKISPTAAPGLTALGLAPKSIPTEVSPIEKVKQKYKLSPSISISESTKTQNGQHTSREIQQTSTYQETSPTTTSASATPSASTLSSGQPKSPRKKCVPSKEMQAAMKVLNDSLQKHNARDLRSQMKNANAIVEQEWFRISSVVHADPLDVEDYLDSFEDISANLLQYIVNMVDASGNTAMHYAVSHGNFDVVSILLDSKVCDINRQNKAGYTSVMLVSLAEVRSHTHADVVRRLFSLSDVNVRAKQHGQTALMLAVSHGRLDMVAMLLEAGADINIQDEDGSTALMCAAEHGHVDIVKHFLAQPDCDSTIRDVDGSMALQIAMEAGHRHIGVLLYAHDRNQHGGNGTTATNTNATRKKSKSASASPKMPSSPLMTRSMNLTRALPSNTNSNK